MANVKLTATGREITARRLAGLDTPPRRLRWGTGTTAPLDNDTGLETPSSESAVTGTDSVVTNTTTGDTYRVVGTLTSATNQTITEAALLDSADSLYIRGVFAGIPLEAGDSIQFTIEGQYEAPAA